MGVVLPSGFTTPTRGTPVIITAVEGAVAKCRAPPGEEEDREAASVKAHQREWGRDLVS